MNKLVLIVLVSSASVFASDSAYKLKIDLLIDGKVLSSPLMILKAGHKGSITQKLDSGQEFIDVVASDGLVKNNKGIMMKFSIGKIDRNGKRTVVAMPEILVISGETATYESTSPNQKPMSINVTAVKTTL